MSIAAQLKAALITFPIFVTITLYLLDKRSTTYFHFTSKGCLDFSVFYYVIFYSNVYFCFASFPNNSLCSHTFESIIVFFSLAARELPQQQQCHSDLFHILFSKRSQKKKKILKKLGQHECIGLNPLFVCLNVHLLWLVRFLAVRDKIQFWFILNLTIRRMRRAVCV